MVIQIFFWRRCDFFPKNSSNFLQQNFSIFFAGLLPMGGIQGGSSGTLPVDSSGSIWEGGLIHMCFTPSDPFQGYLPLQKYRQILFCVIGRIFRTKNHICTKKNENNHFLRKKEGRLELRTRRITYHLVISVKSRFGKYESDHLPWITLCVFSFCIGSHPGCSNDETPYMPPQLSMNRVSPKIVSLTKIIRKKTLGLRLTNSPSI